MKILFWTDGFWPRLGGIETQAYEFIVQMQKRGHQFVVIAQQDFPSWKKDEIYQNITIKRFDFNAIIEKRDLSLMRTLQGYLESLLLDFQPELIHLNTMIGGSALAFLLLRNRFQIPIALTAHAPYLFQNNMSVIVTKIASAADQVGCVSTWVLNEMRTLFPSIKDKLKLIYNGLPFYSSSQKPLSFSPPILLLFGRLVREKGFNVAIQAFSLLKKRNSNAQLVVAGGGPERFALEQLVNELNLNASVKFTGVLTSEEVIITFSEATVVIVPSIIESFGLVILEAMQMQRPVVASNVEGVPEVIADGETGILVPPGDPLALCNAIEDLLNHPQRAIEMGIKGCKRAEYFSIEQNALQYENLYRECQLVSTP